MIRKTYQCDLCHDSDEAKNLVGLYWSAVVNGWTEQPSQNVEHHICRKCLFSLRRVANDRGLE